MDAVSYLTSLSRLCDYYTSREMCGNSCPVISHCRSGNNKTAEEAKEAIAAVEKWSKENPPVTNGDKVMEIIKDAGVPVTARGSGFDREFPVNTVHIAVSEDWWDAEYKGE
jgi:hypothetical protein